jgi:hypothetical protein
MFGKKMLLVTAAMTLLSGAAMAQADETRIRQADQDREVRGVVAQPLLFTVTGPASDLVAVQLANNAIFAAGTIGQLRSSPFVREVIYHTGGQISLRLCFPSPQAAFNGGTVSIQRGALLIDRDRIVLR